MFRESSNLVAVTGNKARPGSAVARSPGRVTPICLQRKRREAPRPLLNSAFRSSLFAPAEQQPSTPTRLPSQSYCGHGCIVGSNPDRSRIVIAPMTCKSWDCAPCGARKRQQWIHKFQNADPEREITLTIPKGKWPDPQDAAWHMKKAWTELVRHIRRTFGSFEYGLVWELTKAGTPHMHILSRGKYIPQKWLRLQWIALGMGSIVHITTVKNKGKHAAHLCKYLAKSTGQTAAALAPMRIIQVSKNFLKPEPEPASPGQYADFEWVFSPLDAAHIVEPFLQSARYLDIEHRRDGTLEVFLDPDPPPDDIVDTPEMWVAHPSLLQGVTRYTESNRCAAAFSPALPPSPNAAPYVPFDLRKSRAPTARDLLPW
ncbi:hypothetical protein ES705_31508 [subsurface metagenome]